MLRFYFIISLSVIAFIVFKIRYYIIMKEPDKYSEYDKYELVRYACRKIRSKGRIQNKVSGLENLPTEGGYIMYPNHQGRYDALGIILTHDEPCSIVVDSERSKVLVLNEVTSLLGGQRLDKSDARNQIRCIMNVATEVSAGRKYIIFPEGGYEVSTDNSIQHFMPGSFKAAVKSKAPIVPIALIDSFNIFTVNSLKRVTCEIHYLPPIYYDEYKNMNTQEISSLVKTRIENRINEVLAKRNCG